MEAKIYPSLLAGQLNAPASKSCTQRAMAAALVRRGKCFIKNAGDSQDEKASVEIIKALGARVEKKEQIWLVDSENVRFSAGERKQSLSINCGESGLSTRMFASIAALFDYEIELTGEGSILSRPMDFLELNLPKLGVKIGTAGGRVPVRIKGPLIPRNITVNCELSSQFLTGLLFAYCGTATVPVRIEVEKLASRPYIDLTVSILKDFGFNIQNNNYESFDIRPPELSKEKTVDYTVEGDWSNAAFLLVGGAVSGGITLRGMNLNSVQGDKKILNALSDSGTHVIFENDDIIVKPAKSIHGFNFDATDCPDLFPPLVALAANCTEDTKIRGVHRLFHKESDRAAVLKNEFEKMNVSITFNDDEMIIKGANKIRGAVTSSHNDHRIAMAVAIAALNADAMVEIKEADAVNKSYPGFYTDLKTLGVSVE